MENIIPFNYEKHEVRTVIIDGEPWFVAKDVCDVFGDTHRNRTMQSLDDDEKGYTQMATPGGEQSIAVVNESGLYSMLFTMQPTKARGVSEAYIKEREQALRTFKRWITHEVIPQIRKTGQYQQKPMSLEEMFALQAKINLDFSRRMTTLETRTDTALKALVAPTQKDWQQTTLDRVKRIGVTNHLMYSALFNRMYAELENACRVDLDNRVTRAKNRLKAAGATASELQGVNRLYVIARDPKLKTAFDGILRRTEASYARKAV